MFFPQCPLYGKAKEPKKSDDKSKEAAEDNDKAEKQNELMQDGLVFKQCVRDKVVDRRAHNQVYLHAIFLPLYTLKYTCTHSLKHTHITSTWNEFE